MGEHFLSSCLVQPIRDGYSLEFTSVPLASLLPNNRSAREALEFVKTELERLEAMGCIEKVVERPHIVNPLSVVFSNKWRLVLNGSRCRTGFPFQLELYFPPPEI